MTGQQWRSKGLVDYYSVRVLPLVSGCFSGAFVVLSVSSGSSVSVLLTLSSVSVDGRKAFC